MSAVAGIRSVLLKAVNDFSDTLHRRAHTLSRNEIPYNAPNATHAFEPVFLLRTYVFLVRFITVEKYQRKLI